jgi:hypothetical protein
MILGRQELVPSLRAWAYLTAAAEPLEQALPASLGWLRRRWEAGDDHLPLGLVHDLGFLLLRGRDFRFSSSRDLAVWPEEERAERLAYEDRVLGRWALDPSVVDAHVAIAGMPAETREAAVTHAVGLALARALRPLANDGRLAAGNPAHLRALAPEVLAQLPVRFEDWRALVDTRWTGWAREQLQACTTALPVGRLLSAGDLWEIAHLPDLPSESARLALRELHGLMDDIGPVSTAAALALGRRAREVPVEQETADHYPAGGFDAVSTRGAYENLVRSEIAYVGVKAEPGDRIDLFDIRAAEGELLYYTRDESPLLDARRDALVILDRPAEMRHKHPRLPAQLIVVAQALALALQADLVRVFGPAAARLTLAWHAQGPADEEAAREELALVALALGAEIAHHRATLAIVARPDELPARRRIVLSPRGRDLVWGAAVWVRADGDRWRISQGRQESTHDVSSAAGLRAVVDALLVLV